MPRNARLELTWIGKDERPRLEPRVLVEDPALSYHAARRVTANDRFDNKLIFGDNLLALKALEQEYAGKVKCVFIDPPYNTGSAFEQYDDAVEHSLWLTLIRDRLEVLRHLMATDGSIWISIGEQEAHYLKLLCDETFGRANCRAFVSWQRKYSVSNNARGIAPMCDYILVYSRTEAFENNLLPRTDASRSRYTNPDNDPRGPWKAVDYLNQASPHQRPNLCYVVVNPNTGERIGNPRKAWKYDPDTHRRHVEEGRLWWGNDGTNSVPALKLFLSDVRDGMTPSNWWPHEESGHTDEAKKESIDLFGATAVFATPKPERLLKRVLDLATNPGDLVLDSFAGSGTTGAVAHKMGRRWIMVEMGEHCHTHIIPRLKKVIDGTDAGGVTEAANWQGGGGFRYYRLAPSLLEKDRWGNWVISSQYNPAMLAEAVCKIEGFRYDPSADLYWLHGRSSERDCIYVTTQELTAAQLDAISAEVGPERTLLICCASWPGGHDRWPNLTLKKIPNAVLARCEFGRDDYSLQISALPEPAKGEAAQDGAAQSATTSATASAATPARHGRRRGRPVAEQPSLLDDE